MTVNKWRLKTVHGQTFGGYPSKEEAERELKTYDKHYPGSAPHAVVPPFPGEMSAASFERARIIDECIVAVEDCHHQVDGDEDAHLVINIALTALRKLLNR